MIIGGRNFDVGQTNDIELVSLDANPVPDCLSTLNPFPFGSIYGSAGAAMASGMKTRGWQIRLEYYISVWNF